MAVFLLLLFFSIIMAGQTFGRSLVEVNTATTQCSCKNSKKNKENNTELPSSAFSTCKIVLNLWIDITSAETIESELYVQDYLYLSNLKSSEHLELQVPPPRGVF